LEDWGVGLEGLEKANVQDEGRGGEAASDV
jgi:hypothetical protein